MSKVWQHWQQSPVSKGDAKGPWGGWLLMRHGDRLGVKHTQKPLRQGCPVSACKFYRRAYTLGPYTCVWEFATRLVFRADVLRLLQLHW